MIDFITKAIVILGLVCGVFLAYLLFYTYVFDFLGWVFGGGW